MFTSQEFTKRLYTFGLLSQLMAIKRTGCRKEKSAQNVFTSNLARLRNTAQSCSSFIRIYSVLSFTSISKYHTTLPKVAKDTLKNTVVHEAPNRGNR